MCKEIIKNTKKLEEAVIASIKEMEEMEKEYILPEEIEFDKGWE